MTDRPCAYCKGPMPWGARADRLTCSERCKKARQRAGRIAKILAGHVADVRAASVPATTAAVDGSDRRAADVAADLERTLAAGRGAGRAT